MPDAFTIAEHYRGLLMEFASDVCDGHQRSTAPQMEARDKLRPTPISEVRDCIQHIMSVPSSVPMAWRLGEFASAKGSDLIMARVLASRNIGDALNSIQAYHGLFTNIRTVSHHDNRGAELAVVHSQVPVDDDVIRFLFQVCIAGKLSRMFGIYSACDKHLRVDRNAPSFGHLLERFNRELDFVDIDFRDDEVAMTLNSDILAHPIADVNEQVLHSIDHELRRKAAKSAPTGRWKDRIKSHLRTTNFSSASLDEICDTFRVPKRRLCRMLRDEETSFSNILRDLRRERAIYLVQHTDLPLKRVAAELGFNSDASFCMAFKSWVGEAPKRYRMQAAWRNQANDVGDGRVSRSA